MSEPALLTKLAHAREAQARDQVRRFSAQAAGIDGHAFAQHIVLGAMIFDEADVTCSLTRLTARRRK